VAKNDEAVTYVNSNVGFGRLRIVKGVDRMIYIQRYWHGGRTSITTATTWCIYRYLLIFSTLRLRLNFIPLYYLLLLLRGKWGYCSLEVQSCTFTTQFYITDISITMLYLVIPSTLVKASRWSGREQDDTWESKGSLRTSMITRWFRGCFW